MLSLAGLVLSMLLPEIGRGSAADTARAVRSQSTVMARRAELQFRAAIRLAAPDPSTPVGAPLVSGDERTLRVTPTQRNGDVPNVVTFRIASRNQGGALVLEQRSRRETLAEWDDGDAAFAFFSDGAWRREATLARVDMVRLSLDGRLVWIEKLSRPPIVAPDVATRQIEGGGNLDR